MSNSEFLNMFFLEIDEFVYIFFFFLISISEFEGVNYSTGLKRGEPRLICRSEELGG